MQPVKIYSRLQKTEDVFALYHDTNTTQPLHAFACLQKHYLTDKLDTEKVIKFNADSRIDRRKRTAVTIQFIVAITISNKAIFFNKFSNNFIYLCDLLAS